MCAIDGKSWSKASKRQVSHHEPNHIQHLVSSMLLRMVLGTRRATGRLIPGIANPPSDVRWTWPPFPCGDRASASRSLNSYDIAVYTSVMMEKQIGLTSGQLSGQGVAK